MKKMKRLVCTLLAVLTVFGMFATTASAAYGGAGVATVARRHYRQNAYNLGFYTDWCEKFVGLCAYEAGLVGSQYSLDSAEEMMQYFMKMKSFYASRYCYNNPALRARLMDDDIGVDIKNAHLLCERNMPKVGDIVLFMNGDYPSNVYWCNHVGIVVSVVKGSNGIVTIRTIEGNVYGTNWANSRVDFVTHEFNLSSGRLSEEDTHKYIVGFGRFN